MQLSAANLLIASQQIARGAAKPSPQAQAQFAAALAKEEKAVAPFEPMAFKQAAAPSTPAPAAPALSPSAGYGGGARLGATIDIRV